MFSTLKFANDQNIITKYLTEAKKTFNLIVSQY